MIEAAPVENPAGYKFICTDPLGYKFSCTDRGSTGFLFRVHGYMAYLRNS